MKINFVFNCDFCYYQIVVVIRAVVGAVIGHLNGCQVVIKKVSDCHFVIHFKVNETESLFSLVLSYVYITSYFHTVVNLED